jgi:outer membrane lipoprotein SlyB
LYVLYIGAAGFAVGTVLGAVAGGLTGRDRWEDVPLTVR